MNIRDAIQDTTAFKDLSKTSQIVTAQKANVKFIQDNLKIAHTIGYQKWSGQANPTKVNKKIINELIRKEHGI